MNSVINSFVLKPPRFLKTIGITFKIQLKSKKEYFDKTQQYPYFPIRSKGDKC